MSSDFEHGGLKWVIDEIFETLKQARTHFESFVEDGEENTELQHCIVALHQVTGSLTMLELEGAALLSKEIELLARTIYKNKEMHKDEFFEVLMRAFIQLPDYIEYLHCNTHDLPVVLLPILNDLRAARNKPALTQSNVFFVDLSLDEVTPESDNGINPRALASKARPFFQTNLLSWYKNAKNPQALNNIKKVISKLKESVKTAHFYQLFSLIDAFIDGVIAQEIPSNKANKQLLGRTDLYVRQLISKGELIDYYTPVDHLKLEGLEKNLLFCIAHSTTNNKNVLSIKEVYQLDELVPGKHELEDAQASIKGANIELMETVTGLIVTDLGSVKEQLDVFVRNVSEDSSLIGTDQYKEKLQLIISTMTQVAETLAMLGQKGLHDVLQEKIVALKSLLDSGEEPDRSVMMDVAGVLLFVESSVTKLAQGNLFRPADESEVLDPSKIEMTEQERHDIVKVATDEAKTELLSIKESLGSLIESFDNNIQTAEQNEIYVTSASSNLLSIAGLLEILSKNEGSQILKDCAQFVHNKMITDNVLVSVKQQQHLADAITSLDYYLDAIADNKQELSVIESVVKLEIDQLLGRKTEKPVFDSVLSETLDIWMQDISSAEAKEKLLEAVSSVDQQIKLLQNESADEITQKMELMITSVTPEQTVLTNDVCSSLRWATNTLNRIIHKAIKLKEGNIEEPSISLDPSTEEILVVEEEPSAEEEALVEEEPSAEERPSAEKNNVAIEDEELLSEEELLGESATEEHSDKEQEHDANAPLYDPAIDYPNIKKLEKSSDIDEEIMEIFIEESEEEVEKITNLFPQWKDEPDNEASLTDMRRSFHTLKGSGRLVGAYEMGEFAWSFENLLNQIIDKNITVEEVHFDTVEVAIEMLPEIAKAYEEQKLSTVDSSKIAAYAHILSKGEVFDSVLLKGKAQTAHQTSSELIIDQAKEDSNQQQEEIAVDDYHETENTVDESLLSSNEGGELDIEEQSPTPIPDAAQAVAVEEDEGLDLVLLEIFSGEALTHIANIETYIDLCRASDDLCLPNELLTRSLHTLRGSAHMAEIHAIGNVSEIMERTVKHIAEKGQSIDDELVSLLEEICEFSTRTIKKLREAPILPEENKDLERRLSEKYELSLHLDDLLDPDDDVNEEISITEKRILEYDNNEVAESSANEVVESSANETLSAPVEEMGEYDDELLEIFIEEGEELLDSSEQALQELSDNHSNTEALNRLLRDMHTIKGGARMAGVSVIGDLSHEFESKVEQFSHDNKSFSKVQIDLLLTVHDCLSTMLESLKNGQPINDNLELLSQLEDISDLNEIDNTQLNETQDTDIVTEEILEPSQKDQEPATSQKTATNQESPSVQTPPVSNDDIYEDELLEIFLEEAHELMDSSESALSLLKEDPGDTEQLQQLLRDLHTIKGGARMAGITEMGDIAHNLETQLEQIKNQNKVLDDEFFNELVHAHDTLNGMFDALDAGKPISSIKEQAQTKLAETEKQTETKRQTNVKPQNTIVEKILQPDILDTGKDVEDVTVIESDNATPLHPEDVTPQIKTKPENKATETLAKQERVRVRADVLDELVNYAGEVSIYRARLDQGSNEVQILLDEMGNTIIRMHEQLRRFEMETEAQIQSRIDQAESLGYERYEEFDPLEFDRFSNMQQLTRAMAESIVDLDSIGSSINNLNSESDTLLIQQGRVNTELQESLMNTRMVPFKSQLTRFRRLVRQTANELRKDVDFELIGGEQNVDRRVLEKITAPLEHLLRNAIAHGIETPQERQRSGKNTKGKVQLIIDREGSEISIKVVDDGAGINTDVVKRKAIEKGLTTTDAALNEKDIMQFILESGFTTATRVSQIAGRGVGMDVVNTDIKQLNGTLEIESQVGSGSEFKVLMPLTMSVSRALMVEVGEEVFAIPLVGIENIIRESVDVLEQLTAQSNTFYQWHGEQYQFMHLGTVLGIKNSALSVMHNKAPLLLARSGEKRVALFVDGLLGTREIVVKSVGPQLSTVKGVTGATILGDGKISLILDLAVLAREASILTSTSDAVIDVPSTRELIQTVMVVDDSITVRKVTQRLLKRHDYNVITAKDGVDAIAILHETIPDVMLLDIEMPRMDGFELAAHMRDGEQFKDVPIIMITSRTGDKHKDRAMKIGVNDYMGKPFQEHDLIAKIKKILDK